MKIKVGKREIGDGCPVFIIAEVGSNYATLDDCLTSIAMAKKCGADAVKFQLYNWEALYGCDAQVPKKDMAGTLPLEWLPKLKENADACGIEFMCSAFSPELIDAVDPYVNLHKVASAECCHVRMLERLRAIGKPVLLSTGGTTLHDLRSVVKMVDHTRTVFLYCVSGYPARRVLLPMIPGLRAGIEHTLMRQCGQEPTMEQTVCTATSRRHSVLVGFSDHSTDVYGLPYVAQELGACVIEKHVNFAGVQGPDAAHSLTVGEFTDMVSNLCGHFLSPEQPNPDERDMYLRHNRRLIATRDIAEGDTLTEGHNFGIYRSLIDDTHAFCPFMINEVAGKVAKRAIKAGQGIGPGDI